MFRKSFTNGRSMYFGDSEYEYPQVAHQMNTLEAVGSVLDEDGKGGYRFDRMAFKNPIDILGFFLGYMSGPIIEESREEREERHKHVVVLPEEACPIGIALKSVPASHASGWEVNPSLSEEQHAADHHR